MPWGVSIEVGSSRMSTREPFQSALMISMCCCWPSARVLTRTSGSTVTPSAPASSASRARAAGSSRTMPGFEPSIRFSSTVSVGMRLRCWYTMPMPSSRPALGESMRTSRPSTWMVPLSGWYSPDRMLIRVDLPAPFSPSRHSTSPGIAAQTDAVVGDDARERLGDAR